MKIKRLAPLFLLLLSSLSSLPALAQLDLELGYRWVDVTGNPEMYRSQVNEREGFLLRSLSWDGQGFSPTSVLDNVRVEASDLGAGPAGAFRLTAGLTGAYRLDLSYRRTEHFSALPAFANPLFTRGVIPGQHTLDRVRNTFDAELTLLPGTVVSPFVGYSRNAYSGPGSTTYTIGGDDFLLRQDLESQEQEFRLGADFSAGVVSGRLVQGWRKYKERESVSLARGAGSGNGTNPVLGQDVTLSTLTRTTRADASTPVTTAVVAIAPLSRLKLVGSYVRASADGDTSSQEDLSGNLVSFELSRFFKGLSETTRAEAESKSWRGAGRLELNLVDGLDLSAEYFQRHRSLEGYELISSLFSSTTTFAGLDPKDILRTIEARTSLERTEKVLETRLSAKAIGPLSAFVGYASEKHEISVDEDVAELVVPGSQEGDFTRKLSRLDAGLSFRMAGAFLSADWQRARADNAVVRLDFNSKDRYRARAGYERPKLFRIALSAAQTDTKNDWPGIDRNARSRQYGGELSISPLQNLSLRASAFRHKGESTMTIRLPQVFTFAPSDFAEDGRSFELGAGFSSKLFSLDGSYSRFLNRGDLPFAITRARLGGQMAFTSTVAVIGEWGLDDYREVGTRLLGDFHANRYGLFLRFHP